jgi:hypothetical protein
MPHLVAGSLLDAAVEAYRATRSYKPGAPISETHTASASILFANISTEAFINEIGLLAPYWSEREGAPNWLGALGEMLERAEVSHSSVQFKYQLAKFVLSGKQFDAGSAPFQHFDMLVNLRNLIVHAKPTEARIEMDRFGKSVWVRPKLMVRLQEIGVVKVEEFRGEILASDAAVSVEASFFGQVCTHSVARWACLTAAEIVNAILEALPEEPTGFTTMVRSTYSTHFNVSNWPTDVG